MTEVRLFRVRISFWSLAHSLSGYIIERFEKRGGGDWAPVPGMPPCRLTSCNVTGLAEGETYQVSRFLMSNNPSDSCSSALELSMLPERGKLFYASSNYINFCPLDLLLALQNRSLVGRSLNHQVRLISLVSSKLPGALSIYLGIGLSPTEVLQSTDMLLNIEKLVMLIGAGLTAAVWLETLDSVLTGFKRKLSTSSGLLQ